MCDSECDGAELVVRGWLSGRVSGEQSAMSSAPAHSSREITREREVHKREEAIQHFRALMSDMVRQHNTDYTHNTPWATQH